MSLLYSPADMEAQRKVKSVFDPDELANPGKVLPAAESVGGGAR
jgi:glycolate oxidase